MITSRLGFDDISGCNAQHEYDFAIVHACKDPCHRGAVGYEKSLPPDHPHYLSYQRDANLYLNLVDPPVPLFKSESFALFFAFVDQQISQQPVLIHCNKGESRAPSLALLYAARRLGLFPNETYTAARASFEKQFPYKPGGGIATFLNEHWHKLG